MSLPEVASHRKNNKGRKKGRILKGQKELNA